jgi:N-acetylneuraminate synthase
LPQDAQLLRIEKLRDEFGDNVAVGYSDHVAPNGEGNLSALEAATFLGAVVLEKHFTLDRTLSGNDHYHAMDELGLMSFNRKIAEYRELLGEGKSDLSVQTLAVSNARRRVVASMPIPLGATISSDNVIALRSNFGIPVADWDKTLGRKTLRDIRENEPITPEDIE